MLLREHLLENAVTVLEVLREFALLPCMLGDLSVFKVFLWWFDGPAAALPSSDDLGLLGVREGRGRLASAGSDRGGGGGCCVCFPLHSLFLKQQMDRLCEYVPSSHATLAET